MEEKEEKKEDEKEKKGGEGTKLPAFRRNAPYVRSRDARPWNPKSFVRAHAFRSFVVRYRGFIMSECG